VLSHPQSLRVRVRKTEVIRSDRCVIYFESSGDVTYSLFKAMLFTLPPELCFYIGEKLSQPDLWSLEIERRYETFMTSLTTKLAHNLSKTYPLPTENMVTNVEDVRGPNRHGLIVTNAAAWPPADHFFPRQMAPFALH